jgi:hypothetical protein
LDGNEQLTRQHNQFAQPPLAPRLDSVRASRRPVDITAAGTVAHSLRDHQEFGGIIFPTRRRIYPHEPDRKPNKEVVIISADLSDFELSRTTP